MLKVFFWWNKFHSRLDVIWGKHVFCSFITSLRASGFTGISRSNCLQVFCRKSVFRNFAKFTWKNLCQGLFFNKVAGLRISTLLKKRLWHRYFHVDFAKSLRTNFFLQNTSGGWFCISGIIFWRIVYGYSLSFFRHAL